MRLIVIIATSGRRAILAQTLRHLEQQTYRPDEIIVSAPDETHVCPVYNGSSKLTILYGRNGLTAQRNLALQAAASRCDLVTFFDDDFLPASTYLERLIAAFEDNSDWAVITGTVVRDGATTAGLTFAEGLDALAAAEVARPDGDVTDVPNGYGCNMSIRARDVETLRFDERLVLYGWQEDVDFTAQLRTVGRIVKLSRLVGVHLGAKTGRISGVRFGYSQIANPVYLLRKGTVPVGTTAWLMVRNVAMNVVGSLRPEPWIDRRGRLWGNLLATAHVLSWRIEPEYIRKL